jgi:glycosyltransferase involved in cell wall biosynthesis
MVLEYAREVGSESEAALTSLVVPARWQAGIAVIIPAFNEEGAIVETVHKARSVLSELGAKYEIIVVDDGSVDTTAAKARDTGARVLRHSINRGYGNALKTGIRATSCSWIAITDADGTYPIEDLLKLLEHAEGHDMVVGARTGARVHIPFLRRPAKWLIGKLANYLSGFEIPDLNSGLRVFRRDMAERFMSLYPDGFSFTTTITVASLSSGYDVKFVPIDYHRRIGTSSISPLRDFFGFILLVVRLATYFKPLNVFLPPALVLITLGFGKALVDLVRTNAFGVGSSLVLLMGVQLGFLGLLADLVLRRTKL